MCLLCLGSIQGVSVDGKERLIDVGERGRTWMLTIEGPSIANVEVLIFDAP
jgi:hypothetical protein